MQILTFITIIITFLSLSEVLINILWGSAQRRCIKVSLQCFCFGTGFLFQRTELFDTLTMKQGFSSQYNFGRYVAVYICTDNFAIYAVLYITLNSSTQHLIKILGSE